MAKDIERERRARNLATLLDCPGWVEFKTYAETEIKDCLEALTLLMCTSPEKVTGRTAFRYGLAGKTLRNALEWVDDEIRFLASQRNEGL